MASSIDPTKPVTGNATTESVRLNFGAAKNEIETLQAEKAEAGALAAHLNDTANPHGVTAQQLGGAVVAAGAPCVLSPYVLSTEIFELHNLGRVPDFIVATLVCIGADIGYSIDDVIHLPLMLRGGDGSGPDNSGVHWVVDAATLAVSTGPIAPSIPDKAGTAFYAISPARWKIVITPYVFTP